MKSIVENAGKIKLFMSWMIYMFQKRAFKIVLAVYWVILLAFVISIFPMSKTEKTRFETSYNYYELSGWTVNGKQVKMPYAIENSNATVFMQKTKLPGDTKENCSLMFLSNHNKYKVYVEKKLIYSYGYKEQLPFGTMTGDVFLTVPMERIYSGKTLTIVTERVLNLEKSVPYSEFKLPTVYYGDTASFKLDILSSNMWRLISISFLAAMGFFGLCFIGYQLILGAYQENLKEFLYLSSLSFALSGWMLGSSNLLQFITSASEATSMLNYASLAVISIPFMGYCSEILNNDKKIFNIVKWISYILPLILFIAFATNICDPIHFVMYCQANILICLVITIVMGFREWNKNMFSKLFLMANILAFIICAVCVYVYYAKNAIDGNTLSNWTSCGLTIFIFTLLAISLFREIKYIQECKFYDVYKEMAYTDKLTNCGNRAALDTEILDGTKKYSTLTFVLIDFNHLKQVNDRMGHIAGDKMIRDGAQCLRDGFAPSGKVFRLGGDEFAIVLWDEEGRIEKYYQQLDNVLTIYNSTSQIKISLAKGHCESKCQHNRAFFDEIYSKADKNMYIDKERCHRMDAGL